MKNKVTDHQVYMGCVETITTERGIQVTCHLSLKKSVFKAFNNHWWDIVQYALVDPGVLSLVESFKKGMPNQIKLHREITWKDLQNSPSYEGVKAYQYLKDLVRDYQDVFKSEIKENLYQEYILNN